MKATKFLLGILCMIIAVASISAVSAADPYDGVNRIGTYYQYTNSFAYDYEAAYSYNYYDYIAPPRAGGWFGSSTEWLINLRSPQYTPIPPVHYTNYYQPVCGNPCWFGGGYGYPRATAGSFPYRERIGGVFSY